MLCLYRSPSDGAAVEAVAEEVEQIEAEAPVTDEERSESVRALKALRDRVPTMSKGGVDAAIRRLLGGGKVCSLRMLLFDLYSYVPFSKMSRPSPPNKVQRRHHRESNGN